MPVIPASRLDAMCGSAVLTTAMSSMSMAVARHTTARVPRRLNMSTPFAVENEAIAVSLGAGRSPYIGGTLCPGVRVAAPSAYEGLAECCDTASVRQARLIGFSREVAGGTTRRRGVRAGHGSAGGARPGGGRTRLERSAQPGRQRGGREPVRAQRGRRAARLHAAPEDAQTGR